MPGSRTAQVHCTQKHWGFSLEFRTSGKHHLLHLPQLQSSYSKNKDSRPRTHAMAKCTALIVPPLGLPILPAGTSPRLPPSHPTSAEPTVEDQPSANADVSFQ